jgi:hypothetical protein
MGTKDLADKNKIEYTDISSAIVGYAIGFTKENALLIAKEIRQENIPILGGDVYSLDNGDIRSTQGFYNWDCEKGDNETLRQYIERSYQTTIDYITKFGEERFSYFWKIPICKRRHRISMLDGVPLFRIYIPRGKELFGCSFY